MRDWRNGNDGIGRDRHRRRDKRGSYQQTGIGSGRLVKNNNENWNRDK
jgi:hypothetical protein